MRAKGGQCSAIRRCFLVFTAIALLPLALVYLVTNEQTYKLKPYEINLSPDNYYEDHMSRKIAKLVKKEIVSLATESPVATTFSFQEIKLEETSGTKLNLRPHLKALKEYSKQTLMEKSFRYPLMILGPLKALAKRAVGKTGRSSHKLRKRLKYFDNDTTLQPLPDDAIRTLPPGKQDMVEQRMKARQKHLAQKCSELGLDISGNDSIHKPNPWEFLVNLKYHLIWCNVFKSASSSWMYNFNILAGYSPAFLKKSSDVPLVLARKKYPRVSLDELQDAQNDSITFIIARHPFERLLSAYRDKFIFALPHSFHDKLGSKIVRNYRKNKTDRYNPKYPTFSEFVSWLLDEIRKNNYIDMHLVPASKFCTPCLIRFDIIAKFETLDEDQTYLIEKAGLTNVIMPERRNTGKGNKKTQELLETFYSQLTRKQINGLYNYFRYDFEIFGYSAKPYFNIAKEDVDNDSE